MHNLFSKRVHVGWYAASTECAILIHGQRGVVFLIFDAFFQGWPTAGTKSRARKQILVRSIWVYSSGSRIKTPSPSCGWTPRALGGAPPRGEPPPWVTPQDPPATLWVDLSALGGAPPRSEPPPWVTPQDPGGISMLSIHIYCLEQVLLFRRYV